MNVQLYEKGIQYTANEFLLIAKKVGKMATHCERLKDPASSIRVEAERRDTKKERDQVKVMINVVLPKKTLRAESRRPTLLDAIDRCVEKLEPQITKYKDKFMEKKKPRGFAFGRKARPAV